MNTIEAIARTKGKAVTFLREHVAYTGDDCVLWPFYCNPVNGYGHFCAGGKSLGIHRVMCELAHGPRPTPKHHAAHSCHQRACINPRHLSWKTLSENMLDRRANGTENKAWWGQKGKLSPGQAAAILDLKGKETQAKTAARFDITESNVRKIQTGKTWARRIAVYLRHDKHI